LQPISQNKRVEPAGQEELETTFDHSRFFKKECSIMPRAKRSKAQRSARIHDRKAQDLPLNAEVAEVEVDDPLALEPGEKIVTLRSIRNDPLARLHSHHQIDEAQFPGGRAFQDDWEKAERGPRAVDPTREYVDASPSREPITERQRRAVLRLNRASRELGADGAVLVHEVLILGLTMEKIAERRGLSGQRWMDYFSKRFRECLDRLALIYGFATPRRSGVRAG
jgi:AraC-like DNA-binding protein